MALAMVPKKINERFHKDNLNTNLRILEQQNENYADRWNEILTGVGVGDGTGEGTVVGDGVGLEVGTGEGFGVGWNCGKITYK